MSNLGNNNILNEAEKAMKKLNILDKRIYDALNNDIEDEDDKYEECTVE